MAEDHARFQALLPRYFAGDLDAVEARWFGGQLEASPPCAQAFGRAYDARVAADGLLALGAGDPDLRACFSLDTLTRYAEGRLGPDDAAWVRAHAGVVARSPRAGRRSPRRASSARRRGRSRAPRGGRAHGRRRGAGRRRRDPQRRPVTVIYRDAVVA